MRPCPKEEMHPKGSRKHLQSSKEEWVRIYI